MTPSEVLQSLILAALSVNAFLLKSLDTRARLIEISLAKVIQKIGGIAE